MAIKPLSLILTAMIVVASCRSGYASETGAKLYAASKAEQPSVISTLADLVAIESGSADHAGLAELANYLDGRLQALGGATDRIRPSTDGPGIVRGVFEGRGKLRIMLIAHMDTVYAKGILAREPYHRDGNLLYGPGIADDKGGVAVILHALGLLRKQGWNDYARITVLFNPDEEIGSPGSGETIAKLGEEQDVVLSYEPSPAKAVIKDEGVLLGAAGTSQAIMRVEGLSAHAGAAPEQGSNALVELAYQLLQTRDVAKDVKGAQMNWTLASAGKALNQIPEAAEAQADIRVTAPDANEKLLAAIREKVKQHTLVPGTTTTITLHPKRPMYAAGAKGMALAELARSIYAEMDGRHLLLHPGTNGGTDAGFAARSGKPAVLEGLGLAGWGYHARNEYVEVDSIAPRLYLTARLLMELGRKADSRAP